MVDQIASPAPEQKSQTGGGSKTTVIVIVVIVVLLVLSVGGWLVSRYVFGRIAETATEGIIGGITGSDVDIDKNGNTASVSSDDGSFSMSSNSEWPADMPAEIPRFTAGTVDGSAKSTSDGKSGWSISFTKVAVGGYDSYRQTLLSGGWTESSTVTSDSKMSTMENDQYYLIFTVNETESTGSLVITSK